MPAITLQDDPAVFTITTRDNKTITIDAMELSASLARAGCQDSTPIQEQMEMVLKAVKEVAGPAETVAACTDTQLIAMGLKVSKIYEQAGKG